MIAEHLGGELEHSKFRIALATLNDESYVGLDFRSFIDKSDISYSFDPIINHVIGETVEYGCLLAYLFRRFGYPNAGWDDYKQIAKYYLTTPMPDLVLQIVPHPSCSSTLTFSFLVPDRVSREFEDDCRRSHLDWSNRMLDWYESNYPIPDWMDTLLEAVKESRLCQGDITWRESLAFINLLELDGSTCVAHDWLRNMKAQFRTIESEPDFFEAKSSNWNEWPDDDNLKPYAVAAVEALSQLKTSVSVRDYSINAFGVTNEIESVVEPARSAGYPGGAISNVAPKEFSELHGHIAKIGCGDLKSGVNTILPIVAALAAND